MHPYGKYGVRLGTELSEKYKVLDLGIVWTQIMTAYYTILPTHWTPTFEISISGSSYTNHGRLL
jgi:hypothetical protein